MITFWRRVFSAIFFFSGVLSVIDENVCTLVKESCGLVPPTLPENFELLGEKVDFSKNSKVWEEMYFDNTYLRGKYMYLEEGVEYHLLFDYNVSQILVYVIVHPGDAVTRYPLSSHCTATQMEDDGSSYIFGYRDDSPDAKHSKMFNANRVLRFGGPYPYAFNGTGTINDRGLEINSFFGCVYEKDREVTSAMLYDFTGDSVVPAGGTPEFEIDGTKDLTFESIPVGAVIRGVSYKRYPNGSVEEVPYKISHSFSWFKANPVFEESDFQIPPWMHCFNYRGWKKIPFFPLAFSVRVETTNFKLDERGRHVDAGVTFVDQLFYDKDEELARRDFTPTSEKDSDIIKKFGNAGRVKTVYDFNTGAMYITHLASGRCYARAIAYEDFFQNSKHHSLIDMARPEGLFRMEEENMEYKGQYFFRDINCDVWSGRFEDEETNLTTTKETYMSTNGWHSEADQNVQYGVPVRHTLITYSTERELFQTVNEKNFFNFKAFAPALFLFDVSECVETMKHSFYAIVLNTQDDDVKQNILTYKNEFLQASQYYLAFISHVLSPLRIQRIDLETIRSMALLTFALIEKPDFDTQIPKDEIWADVKQAANFIRHTLDQGTFQIEFTLPKTQKTQVVTADPGSLYTWFPTGKLRSENKNDEYSGRSPSGKTTLAKPLTEHNWILHGDSPPKQKRMKSGAFAALAIATLLIGIAIGIAGMWFYIWKFLRNNSEISIPLETQKP